MDDHHLEPAKQLAAALGIAPFYAVTNTGAFQSLTDAERKFVFSPGNEDTVAFTGPAADLLLKSAIGYDWRGRGACVVYRQSPLSMTRSELLGATIHELGHYVAYCNESIRDDTDHKRALEGCWSSMKTEAEQHDRRWLRATVHLWHRATAVLGHEIPLSQTINLEQYGYSRRDLSPMLAEAANLVHKPIESILTTRRFAGAAR